MNEQFTTDNNRLTLVVIDKTDSGADVLTVLALKLSNIRS